MKNPIKNIIPLSAFLIIISAVVIAFPLASDNSGLYLEVLTAAIIIVFVILVYVVKSQVFAK